MKLKNVTVLTLLLLIVAGGCFVGCGNNKGKPSKELAAAWGKRKRKSKKKRPKQKKVPEKTAAKDVPPKYNAKAEIAVGKKTTEFDSCYARFIYVDKDRGGVLQIASYELDQPVENRKLSFYIHCVTDAEQFRHLLGAEVGCRVFVKYNQIYSNVGGVPSLLKITKLNDQFFQASLTGNLLDPRNMRFDVQGSFIAKIPIDNIQ